LPNTNRSVPNAKLAISQLRKRGISHSDFTENKNYLIVVLFLTDGGTSFALLTKQ